MDSDAVSRLERFVTADFAQVDYTDAVAILEKCLLALGKGEPWYVALFLFLVSLVSFICVWLIEPQTRQATSPFLPYTRKHYHEH
jgi:hypothetical protein